MVPLTHIAQMSYLICPYPYSYIFMTAHYKKSLKRLDLNPAARAPDRRVSEGSNQGPSSLGFCPWEVRQTRGCLQILALIPVGITNKPDV